MVNYVLKCHIKMVKSMLLNITNVDDYKNLKIIKFLALVSFILYTSTTTKGKIMATSIIISCIPHALAAIIFMITAAIFYYKAGDDSWGRGGRILIGVFCKIRRLTFISPITCPLPFQSPG